MPLATKRGPDGLWPTILVMVLVAGAVAAIAGACRLLGFGEGVLLGATPASGVALGAAVVLRGPGAFAAAAGFALADLAAGLTPDEAGVDAAAHGLAALAGATLMRALARRREVRTRTNDWLGFLAGIAVFTACVGATLSVGAAFGLLRAPPDPARASLLALVFEPLGLVTAGALLASLREYREILADPRPAVGIAGLAVFLLGVLWLLLTLPGEGINPSGVTLIVAVPFCLWIAMQNRSLDGAAISFAAANVALAMVLAMTGAIDHPDYVTTILYLNLLVASCQLVHAVNLDRLAALEAVAAHKRDLEARVIERTARLNAMTERALAADAAKTRFLATVSHEVRNPLNGVIGMATVVLAGDLDEVTRRNVGIIRGSGFHLLDVINRILDYSKLNQAPTTPDDVAFDLRDLVDEVLEEARFIPDANGLTLAVEIAPGLAHDRFGYRQGLRQILTNLVANAVKFTEEGGVTVRLAGTDRGVRFEVRDTGIGIPKAARERIFLPFEQVDGGVTRRYGGTGLGLAICAEIVARMGGDIGVESGAERGSVFWFEAPLRVGEAVPA